MSIIKETIIIYGVPDVNGRVYSKENFKNKFSDWGGCIQDKIQNRIKSGELFGEIGHPIGMESNLQCISHRVTNLVLFDAYAKITAETLVTTHGVSLTAENIKDYELSPRGYGDLQIDGSVSNYTLMSFDLILKSHNNYVSNATLSETNIDTHFSNL